jgi:hypothetical protein
MILQSCLFTKLPHGNDLLGKHMMLGMSNQGFIK